MKEQQEEDDGVGVGTTDAPSSTHEFPEVHEFLSSIALEHKYTNKFTENGIEDMETILELNDQHLDALEIPLGYKLKMLKRIKTLRQD